MLWILLAALVLLAIWEARATAVLLLGVLLPALFILAALFGVAGLLAMEARTALIRMSRP